MSLYRKYLFFAFCLYALGMILLLSATYLVDLAKNEEQFSEKAAIESLAKLEQKRAQKQQIVVAKTSESSQVETLDIDIPDYIFNPNKKLPTVNIDGYDYIGTLYLDTVNIALPVLDSWSYDKLKIAPCRYYGSPYLGEMTLLAHNYDKHFGRLKQLNIGDSIRFVDMEGNLFSYRVSEKEIIDPEAVNEIFCDNCDLTLFTCTVGGKQRVIIRCSLVLNK